MVGRLEVEASLRVSISTLEVSAGSQSLTLLVYNRCELIVHTSVKMLSKAPCLS